MGKDELSRKDFLKRLSMLGLIGTGTGSLLAACSGGNKSNQSGAEQSGQAMNSDTSGAGQTASAASDPCTDISALNDQQKQMRNSLKYVGHSPYENKKCNNCQFYQAAKEGEPCGSCTIVPGPINPDGHCTSWSPKQT